MKIERFPNHHLEWMGESGMIYLIHFFFKSLKGQDIYKSIPMNKVPLITCIY